LIQRIARPRSEVMTRRRRASAASAMMRAQSSALMIVASRIGPVPSGRPSGPVARRWISERTKSGATTVTETPPPASSTRSESKKPTIACLDAA